MLNTIFNRNSLLLATVCLFLLTSCTNLPRSTGPNAAERLFFSGNNGNAHYQYQAWSGREKTLDNIRNWDIQGIVGIRSNQNSASAQLNWQQRQDAYSISLYGPVGSQSFVLNGNMQQVMLAFSDGRRFYARNAESLLSRQLGWNLPVSNLYFWIRGLPSPYSPSQKYFDRFEHLTAIVQDGWYIQYFKFIPVNNVDLPSKIALSNGQFNIKVVIHSWGV